MNETTYILGHAPDELRRLELQAKALEPLTIRLLRDAGLADGMSVLDIGTGAGDVALLAGAIVGPTGRVLGIDRNETVVERARTRAGEAQLGHVAFDATPFEEWTTLGSFDLVVGRYVLMHQSDPASFLRNAAAHVRDGGVVAVFEMAQPAQDSYSVPPVQAYDDTLNALVRAFQGARADIDVGGHMASVFAQAGLAEPSLLCETPIGGSASALPEWVARTLQSIGLAPSGEPAPWRALADSIRVQARASNSQLFAPRNVAAWVRIAHSM